jgi:hypothetical protein
MRKIFAVAVVLLAACASKPSSGPVNVVVTPQAPLQQSQADQLRDVASGFFNNYSGPARTVAITLGPQPNVIGVDDRPRVSYEIRDGSGAVIESSWIPVADDTHFNQDPAELYRQTGRYILNRLRVVTGS